ncbi:MAG: hypothetical protein U0166_27615 [Acidobacteriota bacterium]
MNPAGLLGQAWIAVDVSGASRTPTSISSAPSIPQAPILDIRMARSADRGNTWSPSIRINDDPAGAWQWFGTMSVAPNGRIDVVWNDTRNSPTAQTSELTYAFSTDAGATFSPNVAVGPPFDQSLGYPQQSKLGDYYHMVSDDQGAGLAYAATYNGEQDVYYLRIGTTSSVAPADYLTGIGHGPGNGNGVRIYAPGSTTPSVNFLAYSAGQYGCNVAAGDVDGTAYDEILTGPGPGPVFGPQVRGWTRTGSPIAKINYYAYGTLRYGVNVAAGNLDADAFREILTGAGPGVVFGPHVRGWAYDNLAIAPEPSCSYFAYGTLSYGVNAAAGNVDAEALAEILTGPGPGIVFSPQVRGWDYQATITAIAPINFDAFPTPGYGVQVAAGSVDADGYAEIGAAPGPGPTTSYPARFRGFDYDGAAIAALPGFDVTAFTGMYGGRLGLGDVDSDGRGDLIASSGPDPSTNSDVKSYAYDGSSLTLLSLTFQAFPTLRYGSEVAAGAYGY